MKYAWELRGMGVVGDETEEAFPEDGISVGDRIWWEGLSGILTGVMEAMEDGRDFIVRLDNGKQVIINKGSVIKWTRQ